MVKDILAALKAGGGAIGVEGYAGEVGGRDFVASSFLKGGLSVLENAEPVTGTGTKGDSKMGRLGSKICVELFEFTDGGAEKFGLAVRVFALQSRFDILADVSEFGEDFYQWFKKIGGEPREAGLCGGNVARGLALLQGFGGDACNGTGGGGLLVGIGY